MALGNNTILQIILQAKDQASGELKRVGKTVEQLSQTVRNTGIGLTAVGVGFNLFSFNALKVAANFETAESALTGLLGSAEAAQKTIARIKREAATTPFEFAGLTEGVKQLASVVDTGDEAIDLLLNVGKAVTASGGSQVELDRVVFNLKQIKGLGELSAIDLKELRRAIPIFDKLIEAAGTTAEAIRNSADPAKALFDAFEKGAEALPAVRDAFLIQGGNLNQLFSNLTDVWNIFLGQIGDAFKDEVKKFLSTAIELLGWVGKFVEENKTLVKVLITFVAVLTSIVGPLLLLGGTIPLVIKGFTNWGIILKGVTVVLGAFRTVTLSALLPFTPWVILIGGAIAIIINFRKEILNAVNVLLKFVGIAIPTAEAVGEASDEMTRLVATGGEAEKVLEKVGESAEKMDEQLGKVVDSIKEIKDEIKQAFDDIEKENEKFSKKNQDEVSNFKEKAAEIVVSAESDIKSLRTELQGALARGDVDDINSLNKKISEQQSILDSYKNFQTNIDNEVAERRQFVGMNELQQLEFTHTKKMALLAIEHAQAIVESTNRVIALQNEKNTILSILNEQQVAFVNSELEKTGTLREQLKERGAINETYVATTIEQLSRLDAKQKQVASNIAASGLGGAVFGPSIPSSLQSSPIVSAPAIQGAMGPQIGNLSVNIDAKGGIWDQLSAERLGDTIMGRIKDNIKIGQ